MTRSRRQRKMTKNLAQIWGIANTLSTPSHSCIPLPRRGCHWLASADPESRTHDCTGKPVTPPRAHSGERRACARGSQAATVRPTGGLTPTVRLWWRLGGAALSRPTPSRYRFYFLCSFSRSRRAASEAQYRRHSRRRPGLGGHDAVWAHQVLSNAEHRATGAA
jgi:hypothetical protein